MKDYKELIDGLRCCSTGTDGCKNCPYSCGSAVCIHRLVSDALAEIEGKQAQIDRLTAETRAKEQYIAETIGKVIRERDAAIADLTLVGSCVICKHQDYFYQGVRCGDVKCRFEWRGVQEVAK